MKTKQVGLILGPLVAILIALLGNTHSSVSICAAIAALMTVWWVTEAVPLATTALLPIILFPLLGIMNGKDVSALYNNHVIFLFIGGFLMAIAMQRWNLHKRIALKIILITGPHPHKILLGFMSATAILSMWISNTASCMMMIPMAIAIIQTTPSPLKKHSRNPFSIALLLGIAYSASIGGLATLVGTPPNIVLSRIHAISFPSAPEISFSWWLFHITPLAFVLFIITWRYLIWKFPCKELSSPLDIGILKKRYQDLGPITFEEKIIMTHFTTLVILWTTRQEINFGSFTLPGWSQLFSHPKYINDGTIAIAVATFLFMIPSRKNPNTRILNKSAFKEIPWSIVLLFGGGFALAAGFMNSGLSEWIIQHTHSLQTLPLWLIILFICASITFLTELTSNTATSQIILPILASLAIALSINPLLVMIPATLSCSLAFMMPVATPPNAIVFSTNQLKVKDMVRTGFMLNIIGIILISLFILMGLIL